jgi:hypothetical protein
MRLNVCRYAVLATLLFQGAAQAQDSMQALEDELKEAKQQHQDATTQISTNFFTQVDAAMGDSDSAVALYKQAGGALPDPAPVITQNVDESATERDARLAYDQANVARLGVVLQLQCGMLHYAALFVVDPKRTGLQNEWVDWLKKAAQIYPQLGAPLPARPQPDGQGQGQQGGGDRKKKWENGGGNGGGGNAAPNPPAAQSSQPDQAHTAMRETIISKFLGFKGWGDKESGGWAVANLPELYKTNVLDPSRATKPTEDTLAFWTTYIAMKNADEPNNDKWNQETYPPLAFDRASDDYAISPSTEKIEALVTIIKTFPTNTHADEWISRVHGLIEQYRAAHGGTADASQPGAPAMTTAPATDPNVTVTTSQQGDMTIVTTHTNAAPANPPTP